MNEQATRERIRKNLQRIMPGNGTFPTIIQILDILAMNHITFGVYDCAGSRQTRIQTALGPEHRMPEEIAADVLEELESLGISHIYGLTTVGFKIDPTTFEPIIYLAAVHPANTIDYLAAIRDVVGS